MEPAAVSELSGRLESYIRENYPAMMVHFREKGYPFSLQREFDAAQSNVSAMLDILLRYVEEWNLTDVDGQPVVLPPKSERSATMLDNVDEMVVSWLVMQFAQQRVRIFSAPKDSSEPSASM